MVSFAHERTPNERSVFPRAMLSPCDKVKDYEVIAPLGSGGMAMLYLARRRGVGGFSRLVTLKLVHQHLIADESIIKLFLDEARISAHVAHPNVVHVEEVGQCGDSYFIAMEYVHGVSLAELLARLTERRLRLRPKLCVWLAAQVAEALHAAHEAKGENGVPLDIVHHDVSPQNVLIGHTGHVKLIDFGIAKSQTENDHRAGRRGVLGKLRYMSPEQLRLERADRRTDVYALGVMLWEMLAGRSLFRCQRFDDERDWATRENPPPPSKYSKQAPTVLDRVVLKAIAFDPNERYDSAFQFRAALLRADPAAVQLDAPMVAVLMRKMLGDELDRRRASWPSEVAIEIEATAPDVTTAKKWSLDELTADNLGISAPGIEEDEPSSETRALGQSVSETRALSPSVSETPALSPSIGESVDEPTLAATPTAIRKYKQTTELAPSTALTAEKRSANGRTDIKALLGLGGAANGAGAAIGVIEATPNPQPQAATSLFESAKDTLEIAPSLAAYADAILGTRSGRAAVVGSVCLGLGIALGTLFAPTVTPELEPAPELTQRAAALDPRQQLSAAVAPSLRKQAVQAEPDPALTMRVEPAIFSDARDNATMANDPQEREHHVYLEPNHGATRRESHAYGTRRSAGHAKPSNKANPTSRASYSRRWQGKLVRASD
jgi:serine/threonine protein kinase